LIWAQRIEEKFSSARDETVKSMQPKLLSVSFSPLLYSAQSPDTAGTHEAACLEFKVE
jgi:hypothetical protein